MKNKYPQKRFSSRKKFADTVAVLIMASVLIMVMLSGQVTVSADDNTEGVYKDGTVSYTWKIEDGEAHITDIACEDGSYEVNVPDEIEGYPVTSIPWENFMNDEKVAAMYLPDGITRVPDYAFRETPNLRSVTVSDNNPGLAVMDGVLFSKDMTQLVEYPPSRPGADYVIPDGVSSLRCYAFSCTRNLERLKLSDQLTDFYYGICDCDSLRTIDLNMLSWVSGNQIYYCHNIETVKVSGNNDDLLVFDDVLYCRGNYYRENKDSELTVSYYPPGRAGDTFAIPEEIEDKRVVAIMDRAFACSDLREVIFPDSISLLGGWAFEENMYLTTAVLPEVTTYVGSNAFLFCDSLKYVYIPESATVLCAILSGAAAGATVYGIPGSAAEAYINELNDPNSLQYDPDGEYSFRNIAEEKIPQDISLLDSTVAGRITGSEDGSLTLALDLSEGEVDMSANARKGVTYHCGSPEVAEIDERGMVTLKAEGDALIRITASVAEGDEAYFAPTDMAVTLTVRDSSKPEPSAQTISGSGSFTKVYGCDPFDLKQTAMTKLAYKSSNTGIAKVSRSGKVTIVKPGTVKITVTAAATDEYLADSKVITVTSKPARPALKCKAGRRKVRLSWTKANKASGYQIYVKFPGKSKYKKMLTTKARVKAVTHKKLKRGKYYSYKIRAYVKIDGKTYYSDFTKAIKVKVK